MDDPALIADLTVSLAAAVGLLVVRAQLAPGPGGLVWRFRFLLFVAAAFYLLRAADWLTGLGAMRAATIIGAAMIPFAALLLAEGLLRRHAPRAIKLAAAGGLAGFALAALLPDVTRSAAFLWAFLTFQTLGFVAALGLLMTRRRGDFTAPENTMMDRISVAVPVILALLLTDYGFAMFAGLPALSGLAALIVAWIAATFEARAASGAAIAAALAAVAAVAGLAGAAIGAQHGWPLIQTLQATTTIAALVLLLVVGLSSAALRRARVRASLDAALVQTENFDHYLTAIARLGLADGYAFLGAEDLRDYDAAELVAAIGPTGAISSARLPALPANDTLGQSQVRALLDRFAAHEVVVVARTPLTLAIGASTGLADGAGANVRAAFAIARLIAERDACRQVAP